MDKAPGLQHIQQFEVPGAVLMEPAHIPGVFHGPLQVFEGAVIVSAHATDVSLAGLYRPEDIVPYLIRRKIGQAVQNDFGFGDLAEFKKGEERSSGRRR